MEDGDDVDPGRIRPPGDRLVRREGAVRAHGEAFAGISPATYVVAGFIPDVLIEVELDAIVPGTA